MPHKMWEHAGFTLVSAGLWNLYGFTPETARKWQDNHFLPDEAFQWARFGLEPTVANTWRATGIGDAEEAKKLIDQGIAPEAVSIGRPSLTNKYRTYKITLRRHSLVSYVLRIPEEEFQYDGHPDDAEQVVYDHLSSVSKDKGTKGTSVDFHEHVESCERLGVGTPAESK